MDVKIGRFGYVQARRELDLRTLMRNWSKISSINENMSRDAIKMILSELWCLESLSESLSTEQETPIKLRELSHLYRLLRAFSHRELLRDEVALAYLRSDPLLQSSGCLTGKLQKYALTRCVPGRRVASN